MCTLGGAGVLWWGGGVVGWRQYDHVRVGARLCTWTAPGASSALEHAWHCARCRLQPARTCSPLQEAKGREWREKERAAAQRQVS